MSQHGKILVIDDDAQMRSLLEDFLKGKGYEVLAFSLATEALQALQTLPEGLDLIISDIKMPGMDGMEFVSRFRLKYPEIPVLLITAFGSIETAIEAIRRGAYDYVVKPFKLAEIEVIVDRAIEFRRLKQDNSALRTVVKKQWGLSNVIGKSPAMVSIFDLIQRVASANANILITGESGTGKEVIARAIHESGDRAQGPFVAINCTAIPENLLESELFGHAKGSFTGATERKKGLFEAAEGGTLFLDEIGDLDPSLQAKLLRVLQERKIRAVGDTTTKEVDVRIVAATHKDLKVAIKEGRFREDLFYRLSVIPVHLPPLRHRKEDIPLLAQHFLSKYSSANHREVSGFSEAALNLLLRNHWEGNVRELENVVERAVVLCRGSQIQPEDLPTPEGMTSEDFFGQNTQDHPTLDQLERRYIQLILEKTGGRKSRAAQILGINRRTLYRKQKEYNLG